jgi:DNA-binding NarL/FixJ family response regulator
MEIIEAKNGKEGMEQAASFHPDLIFMDIRLPDESGLELTKKIKASWPDTTIIILTHYDFPEYREAASKHGANHFLARGNHRRRDSEISPIHFIKPKHWF